MSRRATRLLQQPRAAARALALRHIHYARILGASLSWTRNRPVTARGRGPERSEPPRDDPGSLEPWDGP